VDVIAMGYSILQVNSFTLSEWLWRVSVGGSSCCTNHHNWVLLSVCLFFNMWSFICDVKDSVLLFHSHSSDFPNAFCCRWSFFQSC
jgi:hypothetical protein